MNGGKRQQRKERNGQRAWQVGAVMAVALVASFSTPARADQTSHEAAARRWYTAQGTPDRAATGSREYRSPVQERQQVGMTARKAVGGQRTRYQVSSRSAGTAMHETAPMAMATTMISEDMPVSQTLLTVMNRQGASCGMSALPAMGLTAVGLLGFSGISRRKPQGQNEW